MPESAADYLLIALGALAAGFVNGLAGFGVALVSLGFWLHVMPPGVAGALAALCSVIGHVQTAPSMWRTISWPRFLPFVIAGLLFAPLGVALVDRLDANPLKLALGVFLIGYSLLMLTLRNPPTVRFGGKAADTLVGAVGGLLGGLAGLSGALTTVWCQLRGWTKDEQRGVYQPFNFAILALTVLLHALSGGMTRDFLWLALICLPGTLIGVQIGIRCYGLIGDLQFRRIVLALLLGSGVALVVARLW
jgi:uncharacterized membrane protein YfcA